MTLAELLRYQPVTDLVPNEDGVYVMPQGQVATVPPESAEALAIERARRRTARVPPGFPTETKPAGQVGQEWGDLLWGATGIPLAQSAAQDFGKAYETGSVPAALSGAGKATGLAVGALPVVGPVARAVGPKAATAAGAGLAAMGLTSTEAGGQSRSEQRANIRRKDADAASEREQKARDAEAKRATAEEEARLERERRDVAERARIEREGAAASAAEKDRLAKVERNKPFNEKYPEWADALPGIGIGVAAGVPFIGKGLAQAVRNSPIRQWDKTLQAAETAATKQKIAPLNTNLAKLDEFSAAMPTGALPPASTSRGPMAAAAGFGGAAAMEARAFPDQWNAYNLPSDNPERGRSYERMLDIPTMLKYGALGAASGASGYKAGGWAFPDKRGPIEASLGMTNRFGTGGDDAAATALMRDAWRQKELDSINRAALPKPQVAAPSGPPALPSGPPSGPPALPPSSGGPIAQPGLPPPTGQPLPAAAGPNQVAGPSSLPPPLPYTTPAIGQGQGNMTVSLDPELQQGLSALLKRAAEPPVAPVAGQRMLGGPKPRGREGQLDPYNTPISGPAGTASPADVARDIYAAAAASGKPTTGRGGNLPKDQFPDLINQELRARTGVADASGLSKQALHNRRTDAEKIIDDLAKREGISYQEATSRYYAGNPLFEVAGEGKGLRRNVPALSVAATGATGGAIAGASLAPDAQASVADHVMRQYMAGKGLDAIGPADVRGSLSAESDPAVAGYLTGLKRRVGGLSTRGEQLTAIRDIRNRGGLIEDDTSPTGFRAKNGQFARGAE